MPKPIKPCKGCGGPKPPGKGKRFCDVCAELRLPLAQQAAIVRSRRRALNARQQRILDGKGRHLAADAPDGQKWCNRCERYRPTAAFGKSVTRKDGLTAYCRACQSDYNHERRIGILFDLTAEQYGELLEQQEGRCAVCRCRPRSTRLAVDHDHNTGVVRGLLCSRCNHKVIGAAKDDAAVLRRAARYLDMPPAQTGAPVPETDEDRLMLVEQTLWDMAADGHPLPLVVHRPDGLGVASVADWPVTMRLEDLTGLLRQAGYGDQAEVSA